MSAFVSGSYILRRWFKAVVFSLAEFAVIVAIVLLVSANRIRGLSIGQGMEVGLGPMHLMYVEKSAVDRGYELTIDPYGTLWILLLLCLLIEGFIMLKFSRPPRKEEPEDDT